jgi:hypothetical protein
VRRATVTHRPAQHGQREPVDLEEDDPGHVGSRRAALALRDPLDDPERVRVVVVRGEDHLEQYAHGRHDERGEQRPPEVVDFEGLEDVAPDLEHERVRDQHEDEAEREHERQPQRGENRGDDRVEHRDDRRHRERAPVVDDVDAGQDECGDPERQRRERPRDQQPKRAEARPFGSPANGLAVLAHPRSRFFAAFFSARCSFCSATFAFASV